MPTMPTPLAPRAAEMGDAFEAPAGSAVEVRDLAVAYGSHRVFHDASFAVAAM